MFDIQENAIAEAAKQSKRMDERATLALAQIRSATASVTTGTRGLWSFTATKTLSDAREGMEQIKAATNILATMYANVNEIMASGFVPSHSAVLESIGIERPSSHIFFDPSYDVEGRCDDLECSQQALGSAVASIRDALTGLDGAGALQSLTNAIPCTKQQQNYTPIFLQPPNSPYRTAKQRNKDFEDEIKYQRRNWRLLFRGRLPGPRSAKDKARKERIDRWWHSWLPDPRIFVCSLSPLSTSTGSVKTGSLSSSYALGARQGEGATPYVQCIPAFDDVSSSIAVEEGATDFLKRNGATDEQAEAILEPILSQETPYWKVLENARCPVRKTSSKI